MEKLIKVFISYARKDISYLKELKIHLNHLKRLKIVDSIWYDGEIVAGENWEKAIYKALENADIILLLISADFLNSDFAYGKELEIALERHEKGGAIVIPIIVRDCAWSLTPINSLQVVPRNGRAISSHTDRDSVYSEIMKTIVSATKKLKLELENFQEKYNNEERSANNQYNLGEVFVTSGMPSFTFVEPSEFKFIKHSLLQKGRGIVIEGPSGIGKTTIITKALELTKKSYKMLSARLSSDVERIKNIEEWHGETVVIDDFHRLDNSIQKHLADYLKYLADFGNSNKKLVVVGIPSTGNTLIKISFDLTNRIDIFQLGVSDDNIIEELISKGEDALNIKFLERANIIRESFGSLQIAQLLCTYTALIDGIEKTAPRKKIIEENLIDVINRIKTNFSPKFDDLVRYFASIDGRNFKVCIEILKELASSETGILNFHYLKARRPELKKGIETLLNSKSLEHFYSSHPYCKNHLLYDPNIPALIIDDPQFKFYLNHISVNRLILITGKSSDAERIKVFISYSHQDEKWLKEVLTHLKHLERKGIVDLWVDKRIKAGENWRREIDSALKVTKVGILLVSQDFLASDFIVDNELTPLLTAVEQEDAKILQLILKPCSLNHFPEMSKFQAVNDPKIPLAGMDEVQRAETLVKLAEWVESYLNE